VCCALQYGFVIKKKDVNEGIELANYFDVLVNSRGERCVKGQRNYCTEREEDRLTSNSKRQEEEEEDDGDRLLVMSTEW
jgi:hypothetical protein